MMHLKTYRAQRTAFMTSLATVFWTLTYGFWRNIRDSRLEGYFHEAPKQGYFDYFKSFVFAEPKPPPPFLSLEYVTDYLVDDVISWFAEHREEMADGLAGLIGCSAFTYILNFFCVCIFGEEKKVKQVAHTAVPSMMKEGEFIGVSKEQVHIYREKLALFESLALTIKKLEGLDARMRDLMDEDYIEVTKNYHKRNPDVSIAKCDTNAKVRQLNKQARQLLDSSDETDTRIKRIQKLIEKAERQKQGK